MAAAPQEKPLGEQITNVLQETHRLLDQSRQELPADGNGKLPALKEAIGKFDGANLARLALGQPPVTSGAEGVELATGFVAAKREWTAEQIRLRSQDIATLARPRFIEAQNAALAQLVEGEQFTVSRREGSSYDAIRTAEHLKRVEEPITGTLSRPRAELGVFTLTVTGEAEEDAEGVAETKYFVNILDLSGEAQLDLVAVEAGEAVAA